MREYIEDMLIIDLTVLFFFCFIKFWMQKNAKTVRTKLLDAPLNVKNVPVKKMEKKVKNSIFLKKNSLIWFAFKKFHSHK